MPLQRVLILLIVFTTKICAKYFYVYFVDEETTLLKVVDEVSLGKNLEIVYEFVLVDAFFFIVAQHSGTTLHKNINNIYC